MVQNIQKYFARNFSVHTGVVALGLVTLVALALVIWHAETINETLKSEILTVNTVGNTREDRSPVAPEYSPPVEPYQVNYSHNFTPPSQPADPQRDYLLETLLVGSGLSVEDFTQAQSASYLPPSSPPKFIVQL